MATTEPQTWPCRKGQHQSCVATPTDGICACECHPNWRARAEEAEQRAETYKQQAIVNGQRRDMEREMRETAEQQLSVERQRAEAAEEREARLRAALLTTRNYSRSRIDGGACWCPSNDRIEHGPTCLVARAALAGTAEAVSDSVLVAMSDSRLSDTALEGEQ